MSPLRGYPFTKETTMQTEYFIGLLIVAIAVGTAWIVYNNNKDR